MVTFVANWGQQPIPSLYIHFIYKFQTSKCVQWLSTASAHRYPDSLSSHVYIACYNNGSNTSCSRIHSDFHMNWKWVSWFRFHVIFRSYKLQTVKNRAHTFINKNAHASGHVPPQNINCACEFEWTAFLCPRLKSICLRTI